MIAEPGKTCCRRRHKVPGRPPIGPAISEIKRPMVLAPEFSQTGLVNECRTTARRILAIKQVWCHFDHIIYKAPEAEPVAWHQDRELSRTGQLQRAKAARPDEGRAYVTKPFPMGGFSIHGPRKLHTSAANSGPGLRKVWTLQFGAGPCAAARHLNKRTMSLWLGRQTRLLVSGIRCTPTGPKTYTNVGR
jgi:hypothetical protein